MPPMNTSCPINGANQIADFFAAHPRAQAGASLRWRRSAESVAEASETALFTLLSAR